MVSVFCFCSSPNYEEEAAIIVVNGNLKLAYSYPLPSLISHSPTAHHSENEGLAYDRSAQHFIVGSLRHRSIHSVSDAGVVDTLITDLSLPPNASILGLAVDSVNNRLLAAVHSMAPLPIFNALAAYDLRTRQQLFLSLLPDGGATGRPVANAVAVDFKGNAYVTNSLGTEEGNFIWKADSEGNASIFSRSDKFTNPPSTMTCRTANRGSTAWPTSARGTFSWCRATPGRCSRSMRLPRERGG
ncbi:unnamed protein product [Linum tenue]|uniref:Uncharacterized protein n=1 Tax=Linum tenue TaxID=586396 RepID=A0AAV0INT8_9ROSI|nr:unnamed protein product [Linum tenue]